MSTLRRRLISIPAVFCAAVLVVVLIPIWLPVCAVADIVRGKFRLPLVRLFAFGVGWAWLETAGVMIAFVLWVTGRGSNLDATYALQRWWASRLLAVLRAATGIAIAADGVDQLKPGPAVMLCRHASLADSLVSAWVITSLAEMRPRYVLKKELLNDPCLDLLGNRLPNHFIDRDATDSSAELRRLTDLAAAMGPRDVAVIFPEGTRSSPKKRASALAKIGGADPQRGQRLSALHHLIPPRPAGTAALMSGAPTADVVVAWHIGFDGMNTFGGILSAISKPPRPVRMQLQRIPRSVVPTGGEEFVTWLDETWLAADRNVDRLLRETS